MTWLSCYVRNGSVLTRQSMRYISSLGSIRAQSTALHFYQNRQLELYASQEAKRLTLRQLVRIMIVS